MEDACRSEQERYRSLTSEYELVRDELVQLTQRSNKENKDYNQRIEDQQSELQELSSSIVSKRSEHDQLLSIYLCFFLSCYLLIFFLFFCLLSWWDFFLSQTHTQQKKRNLSLSLSLPSVLS